MGVDPSCVLRNEVPQTGRTGRNSPKKTEGLLTSRLTPPLDYNGGAGRRVAVMRRPDSRQSKGLCRQAFLCQGRDVFDLHDSSGRNQKAAASNAAG